VPALKAFSSVFGGVRFCPTGGTSLENAPEWLALPAVACVGGTWLVPAGQVDEAAITERARVAASLHR
jgi:2-dehydro-3-deoxyphosphogluconate aldolase/(4S)-4-hydroxy-2-oxoglutarate aldolase